MELVTVATTGAGWIHSVLAGGTQRDNTVSVHTHHRAHPDGVALGTPVLSLLRCSQSLPSSANRCDITLACLLFRLRDFVEEVGVRPKVCEPVEQQVERRDGLGLAFVADGIEHSTHLGRCSDVLGAHQQLVMTG